VDQPANHELDHELLELIGGWQQRLMLWAENGLLAKAARIALTLPDPHPELDQLVAKIATGDFTDLPPVIPLDWDDMEGSACAYAPERGLILINREWLSGAVDEQVFAVFTEQLGHHLDVLFNPVDTPGDEGEIFLECLRMGEPGEGARAMFHNEEAHGVAHLDGETIAVEDAGVGAFCLDLRDLPHPCEPPAP
jgi:hypothetical protein